MSIHKIVITGGSCAGKTTAMSWIQNAFAKKGYSVIFVSEIATELFSSGVSPSTCDSKVDYYKAHFKLQLEKEKVYEFAAQHIDNEKILIVCDRGFLDTKAYVNDEEFQELLDFIGKSEVELRDSYDAVFHLVTAAKGAVEYYTLENNEVRTETPEEAALLDDKIISAWSGHPHLRVIDNSTDFEGKLKRLFSEIYFFLGEPVPYEMERKFLIEYPNIEELLKNPNCQKVDIIQTYLKSDNGEEIRVRQRGCNGNYIYCETHKRPVTFLKRVETERRLSQSEYLERLMDADTNYTPIRKERYCLVENNQYFEIDVYPFWKDKAIMEIEISKVDEEIHFPEFIKVIKEVTDDEEYKNRSLAKM